MSSSDPSVGAEAHPCHVDPSTVHVLLVDDERLSRLVVSNMLKKLGFQVTSVDSGTEALARLEDTKSELTYNILLLDVAMPDVSGLQVLKTVRTHPVHHSLPVIMLSSHQNASIVVASIQRGADDYLMKPVEMKELHTLWRHIVRRNTDATARRAPWQQVHHKSTSQGGARSTFPGSTKQSSFQGTQQKAGEVAAGERKRNIPEGRGTADGGGISEGESEEEAFETLTHSELRTHCLSEIAKFQKVLELLDKYPHLFPGEDTSKRGGLTRGLSF